MGGEKKVGLGIGFQSTDEAIRPDWKTSFRASQDDGEEEKKPCRRGFGWGEGAEN